MIDESRRRRAREAKTASEQRRDALRELARRTWPQAQFRYNDFAFKRIWPRMAGDDGSRHDCIEAAIDQSHPRHLEAIDRIDRAARRAGVRWWRPGEPAPG